MDRTAWIVVTCCIVLLIFYPWIAEQLTEPAPPRPSGAAPAAEPRRTPEVRPKDTAELPATRQISSAEPVLLPKVNLWREEEGPVQTAILSNDCIRVEFTSLGAGVARVTLLKHEAEENVLIEFNRGDRQPVFNINGWFGEWNRALFELVSADSDRVVFRRVLSEEVELKRTFRLKDDYVVSLVEELINTSDQTVNLPPREIHVGLAQSVYRDGRGRNFLKTGWLYEDGHYYSQPISAFDPGAFLFLFPYDGKTLIESEAGRPVRWATVKSQFFTQILLCEDEPARRVVSRRFLLESIRLRNEPVRDAMSTALHFNGITVPPGQSLTQRFSYYAGPKEDGRLLALPYNQAAVMEFGVLGIICRPLLWALKFIHGFVGNYGVAIMLLTVCIKALVWIPQGRANLSMKRMQVIAPVLKELQEKYKNDQQKLSEEMLKVYKDYGVNPFGGCLPLLVQMPIFIGFFWMLKSAIELRHESFLWIKDLSQPDTVFFLPLPMLGVDFPINPMPILMAITMYISFAMTPRPQGVDNPMQPVFKFMPLVMLIFCYWFSSGLSLYWMMQNLLSIVQMRVNLRQPMPTLEEMKAKVDAKRKAQAKRKRAAKRSTFFGR